jgi:hypothetical protein
MPREKQDKLILEAFSPHMARRQCSVSSRLNQPVIVKHTRRDLGEAFDLEAKEPTPEQALAEASFTLS